MNLSTTVGFSGLHFPSLNTISAIFGLSKVAAWKVLYSNQEQYHLIHGAIVYVYLSKYLVSSITSVPIESSRAYGYTYMPSSLNFSGFRNRIWKPEIIYHLLRYRSIYLIFLIGFYRSSTRSRKDFCRVRSNFNFGFWTITPVLLDWTVYVLNCKVAYFSAIRIFFKLGSAQRQHHSKDYSNFSVFYS